MSGIEDALYARLAGATAVGTRVYPVRAPQNVPTPFLTYQRISGSREVAFGADPGMVRARFQFNAFSPDYDEMRAVREEVRVRLERWRGTEAGVVVDGTFIENDQDLWDDDAQFHFGALDILLLYREATV